MTAQVAPLTRRRAAPLTLERGFWSAGQALIGGVDEVGRGPLAGPVVAAAVVLHAAAAERRGFLRGVTDSKQLGERDRFDAYLEILDAALAVGVCRIEAWDIDRENILQSTRRAMRGAVARLGVRPGHLLIDGNVRIDSDIPQTTVVGGDGKSRTIAAASVVAKVVRDAIMRRLDRVSPAYGFASNKGYATADHIRAIHAVGPSPFHRRSFLGFYEAPRLPF